MEGRLGMRITAPWYTSNIGYVSLSKPKIVNLASTYDKTKQKKSKDICRNIIYWSNNLI